MKHNFTIESFDTVNGCADCELNSSGYRHVCHVSDTITDLFDCGGTTALRIKLVETVNVCIPIDITPKLSTNMIQESIGHHVQLADIIGCANCVHVYVDAMDKPCCNCHMHTNFERRPE